MRGQDNVYQGMAGESGYGDTDRLVELFWENPELSLVEQFFFREMRESWRAAWIYRCIVKSVTELE